MNIPHGLSAYNPQKLVVYCLSNTQEMCLNVLLKSNQFWATRDDLFVQAWNMPVSLDMSRQVVTQQDSTHALKKILNIRISIANEENHYEYKPISIWLYKEQLFRWWTNQ